MAQAERRPQQPADEAAEGRAAIQPDHPEDDTEQEEVAARYPLDPGAAYSSEPEPADQSFAEHEHWVRRRDRR